MRVLRIDRPDGRRVRKFDGPSGRGLWYRPLGDEYKVSVTRLTFYVIWHDRHSADWLAALASPYPASPDFPLFRGQNKTPRNTLFINGSTVSTGYSATVEVLCRTSTILYNSRGRSPQPVREASADPGQNPWRPGPKARRRHQPSPAKAGVNLREYRQAPLRSRSRSRSRPRHKLTIS